MYRLIASGLWLLIAAPLIHSRVIQTSSSYCDSKFDATSSNFTLVFDGWRTSGGCQLRFYSSHQVKSWICVSPKQFGIWKYHVTIEYYEGSSVDNDPDKTYSRYNFQTEDVCTSESNLIIRYISQGNKGDADIELNVYVTTNDPFGTDDLSNVFDGIEQTAKTVAYTIIGVIVGVVVLLIVITIVVIVCCCKRRNASAGTVYTPPIQGAPAAFPMSPPGQPIYPPGRPMQQERFSNRPPVYPSGQPMAPPSAMANDGQPVIPYSDHPYIESPPGPGDNERFQRMENVDTEIVDESDDAPLINIK